MCPGGDLPQRPSGELPWCWLLAITLDARKASGASTAVRRRVLREPDLGAEVIVALGAGHLSRQLLKNTPLQWMEQAPRHVCKGTRAVTGHGAM